jgi:hypothetical protein
MTPFHTSGSDVMAGEFRMREADIRRQLADYAVEARMFEESGNEAGLDEVKAFARELRANVDKAAAFSRSLVGRSF